MKTRILSHHEVERMQKEAELLLSAISFQEKGFSNVEWKKIMMACEESGSEFTLDLGKKHPQLSIFALECGYYQFALNLGLANSYDQGRAHLFLHQENEANQIIEHLQETSVRTALLIQKLRLSGKFTSAKALVNEVFMGQVQDLESRLQGEVYLQVASVSFNVGDYQDAFCNYHLALQKFLQAKRSVKVAISSFNLSVCAQYQNNKAEVRNWFWKTEDLLTQIQIPSLSMSVLLFSIEKAISDKDYAFVVAKCPEFLSQQNLSSVQLILGRHAYANALLETGHVLEAEIQANQSRMLMNSQKFQQYEDLQTALELNIESLVVRKVRKTKSISLEKISNVKSANALHLAFGRFYQSRLQNSKAIKHLQSLTQFQNEEDILVGTDLHFQTLPMTARAQQNLLFQLLSARSMPHLIRFATLAENFSEKTDWLSVLIYLSKAYLNMNSNLEFALEMTEKAMHESEKLGLERLTAIAVGFAAILDESKRSHFLQLVQELDSENKIWLDATLTGIFGRDALMFKSVKSAFDERLVFENESVQTKMDLVIDIGSGKITYLDEVIDMTSQSTLLKLLQEIANTKTTGLDKEGLVQKVWGYEYNPILHDQMVYTNIRRLRELVPVEIFHGRYRIASHLKWILIGEASSSLMTQELSPRQKQILDILKSENNQVCRGDLVRKMSISERTALRELTFLLEKNILKKSGSGRSVKYALSERRIS
jgi:tetratricopeptide (TPR) repeat protein